MKHLLIWVSLGLLFLVAGCSRSVVGTYKAEVDIPADKQNDPMASMAKSFAESMTLELKEDKTFTMTMMVPISGTYEVSGDTVKLTPTGGQGAVGGQTMNLEITSRGLKIVAPNGGASQGGDLYFVKT